MIDYRRALRESADPQLADFNSKLTPGKQGIMGVRIPEIRRIARAVVKDDWRGFLEDEPQCFEEEVLKGIVIATAPMDVGERISLTDGFLHHVDNWATCDVFCNSWIVPKGGYGPAWDYFSSLIESGDEFRMRVSLVARMSLSEDGDHDMMLLEDIATHDNPGYYYRMGAAWAVSVIYMRSCGPVMDLLRSHRMEPWTHNKSIQKICESRRVSPEERSEVRALRRRAP